MIFKGSLQCKPFHNSLKAPVMVLKLPPTTCQRAHPPQTASDSKVICKDFY